jgi:hypothetical protein
MSRRCPVYRQLRTYFGVAANRRDGPEAGNEYADELLEDVKIMGSDDRSVV